jgi:predicted nuclease of restriction endonuclease-like (RecB) superfamily
VVALLLGPTPPFGHPSQEGILGALIHQIENQTYEKTLLNQTNFGQTLPTEIQHQAKLAVKDEYTFDFLELADEHSERQLEQAILTGVRH